MVAVDCDTLARPEDSGDAPGGNITGSTGSTSEMTQKCLELLHEALPDASRIGVLINPPDPFSRYFLERATSAAARLGLQINLLDGRGTLLPACSRSTFTRHRAARIQS